MNFFLILVLLLTSITGFAQQTPKDLLSIYHKNYLPTITKRHELFLLEFNKARLLDYIALYKHNADKTNAILVRHEKLMNDWRRMIRSAYDHSTDLPFLASIKVEATNLRRELEEVGQVFHSMSGSLSMACDTDDAISWMKERFRPSRIYQVPHYQFTGEGASHNLQVSFQMNYNTSFGGKSSYGEGNHQSGSAQLGDGSKEATTLAAAGMVAGVLIGSLLGPAGTTVGGYIGLAIGTAVGSLISSFNSIKKANKAIEEMRKTFDDINEFLKMAHVKLDGNHHEMLSGTCNKVFHENVISVFPESDKKAKALLSKINEENLMMEREWGELKKRHEDRFANHQMFLDLVAEGYQLNFERNLEIFEEDFYQLNENLRKDYTTQIAPALNTNYIDPLLHDEKLINLQIAGDAQYNHPEYQNYAWKAINDKINSKLGDK